MTRTLVESDYPSSHQESNGPKPQLRDIVETLLLTALIYWTVNAATGRFRIDGRSMESSLHDGQYVIINKLLYQVSEPERGDIVVFHYPRDPSRDFIKRIIGTAGDEVTIEQGRVSINRELVKEPYVTQPGTYSGSWTLGPEELFVLGDNRNNSSDSHNWGVVPRENLVGRAWVIYWPLRDWGSVPHSCSEPGCGAAQANGG